MHPTCAGYDLVSAAGSSRARPLLPGIIAAALWPMRLLCPSWRASHRPPPPTPPLQPAGATPLPATAPPPSCPPPPFPPRASPEGWSPCPNFWRSSSPLSTSPSWRRRRAPRPPTPVSRAVRAVPRSRWGCKGWRAGGGAAGVAPSPACAACHKCSARACCAPSPPPRLLADCTFNDQTLALFTSSLFIAGLVMSPVGVGWEPRRRARRGQQPGLGGPLPPMPLAPNLSRECLHPPVPACPSHPRPHPHARAGGGLGDAQQGAQGLHDGGRPLVPAGRHPQRFGAEPGHAGHRPHLPGLWHR